MKQENTIKEINKSNQFTPGLEQLTIGLKV